MTAATDTERLWIAEIRQGSDRAWEQLIARFEGRLLAFVQARLSDRAAAEDVVQETFLGFLTSLPHYDGRPLEGYLFTIASHKLTDAMRRSGRRPSLPLLGQRGESTSSNEPAGPARAASSLARSKEREQLEETALVAALGEQIEHCRRRGQWERLKCLELLLVRGYANREVSAKLTISEQTVANYKSELITRLRRLVQGQELAPDVFPELYPEAAR